MSRERGSATVLLAAMISLALISAWAVAAVARIATTRARMSAAADLAALAAARAGDCAAAQRTAADNAADAVRCQSDGPDFTVSADKELDVLPGRSITISAAARAGPP